MSLLKESGIFQSASSVLIDELKHKNIEGKITFLLPTKYISEEGAKVGLLMDHLCNQRRHTKEIFRTFFASSHWESVSGTVKLMRHNHWKNHNELGTILIYDPSGELHDIFQPLKRGGADLVPGIRFTDSLKQAQRLVEQERSLIGCICLWDGKTPITEIDALFYLCRQKSLYTAFDEALLEDWYQTHTNHLFSSPPDVTIMGENIVNNEIPYSSFTMTSEIHAPWNNISNCLTHSSSFSGNTIALSMVLALFQKHGLNGPELRVSKSKKEKYKAYATYVNPSIAWIFYSTGLSPEITEARGSWLKLVNKKEKILDAIAGSGCCLRGHNPPDLIPELEQHSTTEDYWEKLCHKFTELSDLPRTFPAVSGSSAVDIGVTLSLLGNPKRKKVITFKHNYSGKSLISLNLSRFEYFSGPFHPLYPNIIEIDAFDPNMKEVLKKELLSGDVALVWFEMLQGQNLDIIPDEIIDLINGCQERGGYYVGIDEILTGLFRTGEFLCSKGKLHKPDIVALAKGVTDMVFPIAAVLVSDKLYQKAHEENPSLVKKLERHFVNQLGAHIALHGLEKALEMDLSTHVKKMGELFKASIKECVAKSPFHKALLGQGLLLYIKLNKKTFPINILPEEFVEFLMSSSYLEKGKVLFLNSRLTPSLGIQPDEILMLSRRIEKTLEKKNGFLLLLFCVKKMIAIHSRCFLQKVKERLIKLWANKNISKTC